MTETELCAACIELMATADAVYLSAFGVDGYPRIRAMLNLRNKLQYPHHVHLYDGDHALYETTADFGIDPGEQLRFTEAFTFPTKDLHGRTIQPGQYYIGWFFDPDDDVCESDDDNNGGCITSARITVLSP